MAQTKFEAENNIGARRLYIHRASMLRHHSGRHSISTAWDFDSFTFNFVTLFESGFRGYDNGKVNFSLHKQKMILHHNRNHKIVNSRGFCSDSRGICGRSCNLFY